VQAVLGVPMTAHHRLMVGAVERKNHKVTILNIVKFDRKLKKAVKEVRSYIALNVSDRVTKKGYREIMDLIAENNRLMERDDKCENPMPNIIYGSVK
jgi:hypothetical protein